MAIEFRSIHHIKDAELKDRSIERQFEGEADWEKDRGYITRHDIVAYVDHLIQVQCDPVTRRRLRTLAGRMAEPERRERLAINEATHELKNILDDINDDKAA